MYIFIPFYTVALNVFYYYGIVMNTQGYAMTQLCIGAYEGPAEKVSVLLFVIF